MRSWNQTTFSIRCISMFGTDLMVKDRLWRLFCQVKLKESFSVLELQGRHLMQASLLLLGQQVWTTTGTRPWIKKFSTKWDWNENNRLLLIAHLLYFLLVFFIIWYFGSISSGEFIGCLQSSDKSLLGCWRLLTREWRKPCKIKIKC